MKKNLLSVSPRPVAGIENKIFSLRGHRVTLDKDLAELYGVSTGALNQAVKRNKNRSPSDFMFRLERAETNAVLSLRSQFVTLKRGQHTKYAPYAFTEHGAVMLANVIKSKIAVQASIQVVRAFVRLRRLTATQEAIARQLEVPGRKVGKHDVALKTVFKILNMLLEPPPLPPKNAMGFQGTSGK